MIESKGKIKKLLENNLIDDAISLLEEQNNEQHDEHAIVMIKSELQRLKKCELLGTISSENYNVRTNKLIKKILDLLDKKNPVSSIIQYSEQAKEFDKSLFLKIDTHISEDEIIRIIDLLYYNGFFKINDSVLLEDLGELLEKPSFKFNNRELDEKLNSFKAKLEIFEVFEREEMDKWPYNSPLENFKVYLSPKTNLDCLAEPTEENQKIFDELVSKLENLLDELKSAYIDFRQTVSRILFV